VTSAGNRKERSHCRAGSGGVHHGCGCSCTGEDDASTSYCRTPLRAERRVATPMGLAPGRKSTAQCLEPCETTGMQCTSRRPSIGSPSNNLRHVDGHAAVHSHARSAQQRSGVPPGISYIRCKPTTTRPSGAACAQAERPGCSIPETASRPSSTIPQVSTPKGESNPGCYRT